MSSIDIIILSSVVFMLVLLVVVLCIPTDKKKIKKKRKKAATEEVTDEVKVWQEKFARQDKYIQQLREEIAVLEKNDKLKDRALLIESSKVEKIQEKLAQERQWHQKEQASIDKKGNEYKQLKKDLETVQENFAKEHSVNLRLDKALKQAKKENEDLQEKKHALEAERVQIKAKNDVYRQDVAQLKKENTQLIKKKEDTTWIARSEYVKIEKQLKEAEMELKRVRRDLEK